MVIIVFQIIVSRTIVLWNQSISVNSISPSKLCHYFSLSHVQTTRLPVGVLFTLHNSLSCSHESWGLCTVHTTWKLMRGDRKPANLFVFIVSFINFNHGHEEDKSPPGSLCVYLQRETEQKEEKSLGEGMDGDPLTAWTICSAKRVGGEINIFATKTAASSYCGLAKTTWLQLLKSLCLCRCILIETILLWPP